MTETTSVLRPIAAADHDFVLRLNEKHVDLLAPLDAAGLDDLLEHADLACVVDLGDGPVGFVVTMVSGTAYDSVNYAWFATRYPSFYYLDRVVLAEGSRRTGLGTRVYDEVEARAAGLSPVMCLEVNLEPPNEPSLAFHRGRGYTQVGRQTVPDATDGHTVSMLVKELRGPR